MAQSGFAFFFLSVLVGCVVALAMWVRAHWQQIVLALRGEQPGPQLVNYRAAQRRPMDVPYVAQRMLAERDTRLLPPSRRPAWTARSSLVSGNQLRFGF
jgi:hypothetical protein